MSSLYFLLTWFPTYLVQQRGLTSLKAGAATSLPYVAATIGVMLGGAWSDWLLRRGAGISAARKIPIVTGFLGASSIVLVNYVSGTALALALLTFAFFAQGVSSNSWSIIAEVAPRKMMGTTGGIINFTGHIEGDRHANSDRVHPSRDWVVRVGTGVRLARWVGRGAVLYGGQRANTSHPDLRWGGCRRPLETSGRFRRSAAQLCVPSFGQFASAIPPPGTFPIQPVFDLHAAVR